MFNQPKAEAALDRRARSLGVDVRRGVEVTDIDQHDDHVVVSGVVHTPANEPADTSRARACEVSASSEMVRVSANYVVGCDGANSTIRAQLDLPVTDLGFFYDWLIVDVILDEPRVFDPINLQVCDPERPTPAVSGGPGRRRWEFMRRPDESLEWLNDEATAWELLAPWDVRPDNARLERHAVYTFQARYAEQWRSGRVFLAGDAAHQMPPFAGQGMCSGIRDAANLTWKLDLVLDGHADDALLDTYETERLPSAQRSIDFSMELGKVICVPDPAEAALRDEAMAAAVTGEVSEIPDLPGIDDGVTMPDSPHAGHLSGQCEVGGMLFDDVHGVGWRLITTEPDPAPFEPELARWFATIGGTTVVLGSDDAAADEWWSTADVAWVLQRPDFQVYGTAADPGGAAALIDHLRERLGATTLTTTATSSEGTSA
jgi:2-polyprenyl-6-methoxyphenol hydroxylase-like FAD-dependent oxidoreductase